MRQPFKLILTAALITAACASCSENENSDIINPPDKEINNNESTPKLDPLPRIELEGTEVKANNALNDFSFNLFNTIAKNYNDLTKLKDDENITISPISTTICLSMVSNIIDDKQKAEFAKVLGYSDSEEINTVCNKLLRYLPCKENGTVLYLANSIWYNNNYSLNKSFIDLMNDIYGADVTPVDMSDKTTTSKLINDWCAQNTGNLIPQINCNIDPITVMIMANAFYFNGLWNRAFDKKLSHSAIFHGSRHDSQVNMMQTKDLITAYASDDDYTSIAIKFSGLKNRFVLVLPRQDLNIAAASEAFTRERWNKLVDSYKNVEATISLPSFVIEQEWNLNEVLSLLGIDPENANTTDIGIPKSIKLFTKQNVAANVNEEGVKAAAVTYTDIASSPGMSPEYEKIEITFDRPFMFFIENTQTNSILMAGRIANL